MLNTKNISPLGSLPREESSKLLENGENYKRKKNNTKSMSNGIFIKEELLPSCSTEVKKEPVDDLLFELSLPIKPEQYSLDACEALDVTFIKIEKVFAEDFPSVSLEDDLHMVSSTNELLANDKEVKKKPVDGPQFELGLSIKAEESSLDAFETLDASLIKKEQVFVEDFPSVSLQNEVFASNTEEKSSDSHDSCSSPLTNKIHRGRKPHSCQICGKSFSRSSSLKIHKKFQICSEELSQSNEPNNPNQINTNDKPHECNVCAKSFSKSSHLKTHRMIHSGEKPHKCNICGKAFSQPVTLKNHNRIHTGEKPHKCNTCGKAFSQLGTLKNHISVHIGRKPLECDICGKIFYDSSGLKTHNKTHMGQRAIKCNICGKTFSRASQLMFHNMTHFN